MRTVTGPIPKPKTLKNRVKRDWNRIRKDFIKYCIKKGVLKDFCPECFRIYGRIVKLKKNADGSISVRVNHIFKRNIERYEFWNLAAGCWSNDCPPHLLDSMSLPERCEAIKKWYPVAWGKGLEIKGKHKLYE